MKKITIILSCVALVLSLLVSCEMESGNVTLTAEQGLTARQIAGAWQGGLVNLSLNEDGTYLYVAVTAQDLAQPRKSGGFIIEGDYVVLDGYGVDDPDLFLSLRYDAEKDELIREGKDGFTLTRTEEIEEEPETNLEDWYGDYASEAGAISIGQGPRDGVLLAAVTPSGGVTSTVNLTIDGEMAVCESFTLTRDGDGVVLTAAAEAFETLAGRFTKN